MTDEQFKMSQAQVERLPFDQFATINKQRKEIILPPVPSNTINGVVINEFKNIDNDIYGTCISIKKILNRPVIIVRYRINQIPKKDSTVRINLKMQVIDQTTNESYVVYTDSKFIIAKLEEHRSKLPIRCTIYKSGKTYAIA